MSFQKPPRPQPRDHLPKNRPEKWAKPGMAVITYDDVTASCSCGWNYYHHREKVREDAVDRHLKKRHQGRGVRL